MITAPPRPPREILESKHKETTGWVQRRSDGIWFYLRDGLYEAEVFRVCHADTMQPRWAGKIYRGGHKPGQTFEDDYTARSVIEMIVNLMVAPR